MIEHSRADTASECPPSWDFDAWTAMQPSSDSLEDMGHISSGSSLPPPEHGTVMATQADQGKAKSEAKHPWEPRTLPAPVPGMHPWSVEANPCRTAGAAQIGSSLAVAWLDWLCSRNCIPLAWVSGATSSQGPAPPGGMESPAGCLPLDQPPDNTSPSGSTCAVGGSERSTPPSSPMAAVATVATALRAVTWEDWLRIVSNDSGLPLPEYGIGASGPPESTAPGESAAQRGQPSQPP